MPNSSFDAGSDKLPARSVLHQPTDAENNWHPDLSKERPEWRDKHATQKDAPISVDQDGVYVVRDGDTVYDIARRSLKSQNAATDVKTINQEVGKIVEQNVDAYPGLGNNPHLIHPGDQLRLGNASMNVPPLEQPATPAAAPDAPPTQAIAPDAPAPLAAAPAPATEYSASDAAPPPAPLAATPGDTGPQTFSAPPPLVQAAPDSGLAPAAPNPSAQYYAAPAYADAPPPGFSMPAPYQGNFGPNYGPQVGGDYTDREAYRLSLMMANDPHAAANEMRNQLQGLDPGTAGVLVSKTKNDELVGGAGDLQVQVEYNQYGQDTGYRNVTMATPDGIEQIAELQSRQNYGGGGNPLGYIAGAIVGDLLWQRERGINFNDGQYQGWCNREQGRENYWSRNNNQFVENWQNLNYRSNYQSQNWQSVANNPTVNNTYITNNRYDTRTNNTTVNTTTINETINNYKNGVNTEHPRPVAQISPNQFHRVSGLPPVTVARPDGVPLGQSQRLPGVAPENGQSQQAQEAARERVAAQTRQTEEIARQRAAALAAQAQESGKNREVVPTQQAQEAARTQHAQELARERTAALAQQAQEAAKEKVAAQAQQAQEAAREKAAAQAQHVQEAARERAAAQAQQVQEAAREKAAAQAQQVQEAARQKAAAQAQQVQEAAREKAAAQAQQAQEAAREKAAAQAQEAARQKAAAVPPPPQKRN